MVCGLEVAITVLGWVCFCGAVLTFLIVIPLFGWPWGMAVFLPCILICTVISMYREGEL